MRIIIPATTANLGPGFDSLGLALDRYLTVSIGEKIENWYVDHRMGYFIPHDQRNMLVQTALKVNPYLTPHRLRVKSEIPIAHGLGSSSTAIVAGIVLANILGEMHLSDDDILQLAAQMEGHPDNVAPAILGDLTVSAMDQTKVATVKLTFPDVSLVAYIPKYNLATIEARKVLPPNLTYSKAVLAGSIGNALVAALALGDIKKAGQLMEQDQYHEPYREKLVPHLTTLRQIGHQIGAYATYLSGAGPTVMTVLAQDKVKAFIEAGRKQGLTDDYQVLKVDRQGYQILK